MSIRYLSDMPLVDFPSLPATARVWVFGSATPLDAAAETALLDAVDTFLRSWKAHGEPLTVGRLWDHRRFLTIAVDTTQAHASGCSIDGLFRELQRIDAQFGSSLVGGGRLFYETPGGVIQCAERRDVDALVARGEVELDTPVFDTTVQTLQEWRDRFRTTVRSHWAGTLFATSA